MISDLATTSGPGSAFADVCVIGAGIAGLLVATRLRKAGVRVVVLESGGATQPEPEHPLNRVASRGRPYHGATKGRARCLGGTSTLWGGALIPFLESDLEARPHLGLQAWPVKFAELQSYLGEVEAMFGVTPGSYGSEAVMGGRRRSSLPQADCDFLPRFAKWPPFKKRNVAALLKRQTTLDQDLTIWLNATVTAFSCDGDNGRLRTVSARGPGAQTIEVCARHFVFCAGAIESTRLLLLLDRQHDGRVFSGNEALGRYFHDHISLVAGQLHASNPAGLNRLAGFRFAGDTMRSLRFEMSPAAQTAERVASSFGHISFAPLCPSGFDVLRDTLRGLQKSGRIDLRNLAELPRHLPYLMQLGYWRLVHRQLLWPEPARYDVNIVVEQLPQPTRRISLGDETDDYGCPLAVIDWQIEESEIDTLKAAVRRFDAYWKRHGLETIARIDWQVNEATSAASLPPESVSDIYHPGGTTRMGRDAGSSVVDGDLAVFALSNASVASTSVFPSGASANPTFMLMGFALRLADRLARLIAAGDLERRGA